MESIYKRCDGGFVGTFHFDPIYNSIFYKINMNYGLINSIPSPTDHLVLGGLTVEPSLLSSRNWSSYLPQFEHQKDYQYGFDTYGCVSYSGLNCLEILMKKKYNLDVNFSDRFTVVSSDTIPDLGNTFVKVANSIRNDGILLEGRLPFDAETKWEYYKEIDPETKRRGELVANNYDIRYAWVGWNGVSNEVLYQALQYGPIQVTVKAWGAPNKSGVYDYVDYDTNHAVTLFKMDKDGTKWIFDHYNEAIKELDPRFYIGAGLQYYVDIKKKLNPFYFATLYKQKTGKLPHFPQIREYNEKGILPWL